VTQKFQPVIVAPNQLIPVVSSESRSTQPNFKRRAYFIDNSVLEPNTATAAVTYPWTNLVPILPAATANSVLVKPSVTIQQNNINNNIAAANKVMNIEINHPLPPPSKPEVRILNMPP
jgi:hypothetical protein